MIKGTPTLCCLCSYWKLSQRATYYRKDPPEIPSRFQGKQVRKFKFPPLPSVQDLLRIYRLKSVRQLSQTFLIREDIARLIAKSLGSLRNATVYEIGPGPGIITREVLKQYPRDIVVIEKDFRFRPILMMLQNAAEDIGSSFEMINGDCLSHDFTECSRRFKNSNAWKEEHPNLIILGNLPFNISLPFLVKLLHDMDNKTGLFQHGRVKMVFTFQHEIAEQIVADVADQKRGRLSFMSQNMCEVDYVLRISNKVFVPRPECDTGLVTFVPRVEKCVDIPLTHFEKLVKAVMHYKSKQCFKGLMDLFPKPVAKEWAFKLCAQAGVAHDNFPRFLTMDEMKRLGDVYYQMCQTYDGLFEFNYQQPKQCVPHGLMSDSLTLDKNLPEEEFDLPERDDIASTTEQSDRTQISNVSDLLR